MPTTAADLARTQRGNSRALTKKLRYADPKKIQVTAESHTASVIFRNNPAVSLHLPWMSPIGKRILNLNIDEAFI